MSSKRYLPAARQSLALIDGVLRNRGIEAKFDDVVLATSEANSTWLLIFVDTQSIGRREPFVSSETLKQMKNVLKNSHVYRIDDMDIVYAVLLSPKPKLPSKVDFVDYHPERVIFGVDKNGTTVSSTWREIVHFLIAGMTGFGKSNFLRLLVAQAVNHKMDVWLADPDGTTFAPFVGSTGSMIAEQPFDCEQMAYDVLDIIEKRSRLFSDAPGAVGDIDDYNLIASRTQAPRLARVFFAVDEFNSLVTALGGPRSEFGNTMTQIAWRGRKFGIHLALAGQTFEKAIVGPVRDQMVSRVCFRVAKASTSRVVLDQNGAERILKPGRAITQPWGVLQVYHFANHLEIPDRVAATTRDAVLIRDLVSSHDGKVTYETLNALGLSRTESERFRETLLRRGYAIQSPENRRSIIIDAKNDEIREILQH